MLEARRVLRVDVDPPRERFVRMPQDLCDHVGVIATVTQLGSQRVPEDVRRRPGHPGSLRGGTEAATDVVVVLMRSGERREDRVVVP